MSRELQKFTGNLPVDPSQLEAGLTNVQANIQGAQGGIPFLRLLKSGRWVYGAENIELEEASEWAINPYSIQHGYACWGEGELLDERMVPMNQPPPPQADLPDLGQPWSQQVAFLAQCMTGEDEGQVVLYKTTATGGRNAVKELLNALITQLGKTQEQIVPVVDFQEDSYNHKKHGEIFYPVLDIRDWITMDGVAEVVEGSDEGDGSHGDTAAPEPEPSPEPEQTRKPRRRRGAAKEDETKADEAPARSSNRRRRRRSG